MIPVFAPTLVPGGAPVADDAATTAWVAAVVSAGGSVSGGRKTVVNNLIIGLKADGIWTKLDRLWLYAAENSQSALIDIVNLGVTSLQSTPTFTTDRGYTGDGSSKWLITDFNAATASSPKFQQNDAHWGHWNNTNDSSGQGLNGNSNTVGASFQIYLTALYLRCNDNAGAIAATNPTGLWVASRQSSSTFGAYRNGSLSETVTATSAAVNNALFLVLDLGAAGGSPTQVSAYSLGGGLTSTEVGNYYTRIRTYMTAVGVP